MLRNFATCGVVAVLGVMAGWANAQYPVMPGPVVSTPVARDFTPLPPPYRIDFTPTNGGVSTTSQFSLYPLRVTPPTLMTSINYPGVYGAFYIGAAPSAYVPGISVPAMTLRPTWTTLAPAWATPPNPPPVPPAVSPTKAREIFVEEETSASAMLTIYTPEQASVWVQGQALPGTGEEHRYKTPPLPRNQLFTYELRAVWSQDGQPVSDTRTVTVQAGKQHRIGFEKRIAPLPQR